MRAEERDAVKKLGRRSLPPFLGAILSFTLSPHSLVAEDEAGQLIGAITLRTFHLGGEKFGLVEWVFTAPERQGTGTGKALLERALEWFRHEGCSQVITTGVDGYNSRAWNLCEGRGFRYWRVTEQLRKLGIRWPLMLGQTFHFMDAGCFLLRVHLEEQPPPEGKRGPGLGALAATTLLLCLLLPISLVRQRMWQLLDPTRALTLAELLDPLAPSAVLASAAVMVAYVVARAFGHLIAAKALRLPLEFRPWESGLTLATGLALAFGAFVPALGGSFYVRIPRFRYTEARPQMGKVALAGVIPSLALLAAFSFLSGQVELAKVGAYVGTVFGVCDTFLFFSPFEPLCGGHIWRWNRAVWLAITFLFLAIWLI